MARGHLVAIGGAEDREGPKTVLERFLQLAGGREASLVLVPSASGQPYKMATIYARAFRALGGPALTILHLESPADAHRAEHAATLEGATGIFLSGGDQARLMALLAGTPCEAALHKAFAAGACVGGTSAGASAMSERMITGGQPDVRPREGMLSFGQGLGLLPGAIVDQHFSERQRLPRLLSAVSAHPELLGIGLDEDTALVIAPDGAAEVVGAGSVTLVDGREQPVRPPVEPGAALSIVNVRLHQLVAGARTDLTPGGVRSVSYPLVSVALTDA